MTDAHRMTAFPRDCRVRLIRRPYFIGRVVGWSRKYDAIYVLRAGSKSGVRVLGACHLWERLDVDPVAPEEHW